MNSAHGLRALGTTLVFAGAAIAGLLLNSPRGKADGGEDSNESRIERGFDIAPVPLNLDGKNRALVGLGSYLVNMGGAVTIATIPVRRGNSHWVTTRTLGSRSKSTRRRT